MKFRYLRLAALLAFSGTLLHAQALTVAPGLTISNGGLPWALDTFKGKPELVPIHHSTVEVNNHKGANVAGSLAGSFFYKPKMTVELAGLHARTTVHATQPSIYLHKNGDSDPGGESAASDTMVWAVVRATVTKDRRIFAKVQFTQLTGNARRSDGVVDTTLETLPGGWLKLTPKTALEPGEYAVTPILKNQNTFSTVVYDFTLDPNGANASDAVSAPTE
ncbi:hypothetical protein BH10ACI4_BH10ACI4_08580 [soil metagenome]